MVTLKRGKGCLQKQNKISDIVPKGGIGPNPIQNFKLGQRGQEEGGHDCLIPNAAHQCSAKRDS